MFRAIDRVFAMSTTDYRERSVYLAVEYTAKRKVVAKVFSITVSFPGREKLSMNQSSLTRSSSSCRTADESVVCVSACARAYPSAPSNNMEEQCVRGNQVDRQ